MPKICLDGDCAASEFRNGACGRVRFIARSIETQRDVHAAPGERFRNDRANALTARDERDAILELQAQASIFPTSTMPNRNVPAGLPSRVAGTSTMTDR